MRRRSRITRGAAASLVGALVVLAAGQATRTERPAVAAESVRLDSDGVADAHEPSISADGRWIVFTGTVGERQSAFRTDRETGNTTEISPVPAGVSDGDTIHARISADGCVAVAITEIPFDLFRDDDRDERWDVYRLLLPECGGQPNAWELVSASGRTGTALDSVFTDSPPSVSGSGAVVAYAHQARGATEGVATISVVDITVPLNEPGREQEVAGMPVEAPNRAYLYRGARQPALSQNGRHLAFVSDTTASELLPGWADGPELGGEASAQVYVWDRFASDQRRSVHLVSGRNGTPSTAGADAPAVSEDGRIVVFTSRDRTLVPATLPRCLPQCPLQVYRFDRDTDRNGIFDEPPRTAPLAIVSAVDAGRVEVGVPIAGDRSSWDPVVNADGSEIAFVTDATNLLASRRGGGGSPLDGDLLVAEFALGQIRRVLDDPELTAVPGAHSSPASSQTGDVIAFDTVAAGLLTNVGRTGARGRRDIVTVVVSPHLSLAALDFGTVLMGFESTELYAKVQNAGPGAFEPADVQVSSNFRITGGTCVRGIIVAAGTSCSVNLTFLPSAPRGYSGTLTVSGSGPDAPSVSATIRGAAGEPTLLADPGGVDFDAGVVGGVAGRVAIDIGNVGFLPTEVARIAIGGEHPDDFQIVAEACRNRALNPDASCAIEIEFRPTGPGYRSALLIATTPIGQYTAAVLGGFARYEPTFEVAKLSARPGEEVGIGGSGFPAGSEVAIGFDDGGRAFTNVTANDVGSFLAIVTLPGRLRIGQRRLVATAEGGAVATVPFEVSARERVTMPRIPGYGLG